jgi:cardiolipin synthase A/B
MALAIRAVAYALDRSRGEGSLEIAWTGPSTQAVPVRRVDQVMYELIDGARTALLLTSFVTWGADAALAALKRACDRGVKVSIVLETATESGGALEFDGMNRFREQVPRATFYYWPLERRPRDDNGRNGILHVKCLVRDGKEALITSANLTTKALEQNMELGLIVRGGDVPVRLMRHFEQLTYQRDLRVLE